MLGSAAAIAQPVRALAQSAPAEAGPLLTLVSRHIQWTNVETGIEVAKAAGFPAIAWTVRPGAHIEPANVEKELPRVVELTHKAGLATPMIITAIGDANAPNAEAILGTMQRLGIQRYRAASTRYDYKGDVEAQLEAFRGKMAALAKLNERFGTRGLVHTHSRANTIGGGAWDLWFTLRGLDPRFIGINYDIGHVMAKGGAGWMESARASHRYIGALSVKDFVWRRRTDAPAGAWPWETQFVQPGQGMVNFPEIFKYFQSIGFNGPLETYFEYEVDVPGRTEKMDMLGTDYGKWKLEISREAFTAHMKRDVTFYKQLLAEAGFKSA